MTKRHTCWIRFFVKPWSDEKRDIPSLRRRWSDAYWGRDRRAGMDCHRLIGGGLRRSAAAPKGPGSNPKAPKIVPGPPWSLAHVSRKKGTIRHTAASGETSRNSTRGDLTLRQLPVVSSDTQRRGA